MPLVTGMSWIFSTTLLTMSVDSTKVRPDSSSFLMETGKKDRWHLMKARSMSKAVLAHQLCVLPDALMVFLHSCADFSHIRIKKTKCSAQFLIVKKMLFLLKKTKICQKYFLCKKNMISCPSHHSSVPLVAKGLPTNSCPSSTLPSALIVGAFFGNSWNPPR